MPIVINEFEAVAEGESPPAAARDDTADRRPLEPRRVQPALNRLAQRARRTWAH